MIYYCMSDIHGCLSAFNSALELVLEHLNEPDTALLLLGDYVHRGKDSIDVLERIIGLQKEYGKDKVIALMGNHEEMAISGMWGFNDDNGGDDARYDSCINWMSKLPLYHFDGGTIFVHAGVEEEAEEEWKYGTPDHVFTQKFPAQTGHFCDGLTIVAGHVSTSEISGNSNFNGIYFDGQSHYYIDGDTVKTQNVNILKVDTQKQEYYEVTPSGEVPVLPYSDDM